MNNGNFLPPPVRLSQAFGDDAGGGMSRRLFIKRSGGATVATAIAWQSMNQMACAIGEGEGCSNCQDMNPGDFLQELGTSLSGIDKEQLFLDSITKVLGAGPMTLGGLNSEPYNGSISEFGGDLGKEYAEGIMDHVVDDLDLENRGKEWLGKQLNLTEKEIDLYGLGAGVLYETYQLYDAYDSGSSYDVPSAILDSLKWEKDFEGSVDGTYFKGSISLGLQSLSLKFNADSNDNNGGSPPLFRLGDVEAHGFFGLLFRCEIGGAP